MKRPIIYLLVSVVSAGLGCDGDYSRESTQPSVVEQAIVNGTRDPRAVDLTDGEILAIGWLYNGRNSGSPFCTGTLINPWVVVTAQHCTYGNTAANVRFGIGVEPSDPLATFQLSAIHEHQSLDAALLVLVENVNETVPELEPIPPNRVAISDDEIGTAVQAGGYGETRDPSRTGRWFATVFLYQVYPTEVVVDGRGDQGICFGDSGGPIIGLDQEGESVVLGVESQGDASCVDEDHLTRVDVFYEWLQPVLEGEEPIGPCGELDGRGRCAGDVLEWCHPDGTIRQEDCVAAGEVCTFHERFGYFCAEPTDDGDAPPDADTPDAGLDGGLDISTDSSGQVETGQVETGQVETGTGGSDPSTGESDGCSLAPRRQGSSQGWAVILLLMLALVRRRRD